MKRTSLTLSFVLSTFVITYAQYEGSKQTYSSPKLGNEIRRHKRVAILPFETSITYRWHPKKYNASANANEQIAIANSLQQSMYTYLLKKSNKYTVSFQDVTRTNSLLKAKGIYNKIDQLIQDSICRALGVDAVVRCSYAYEKIASDGAAIAKIFLFGGKGSKTGRGALTMHIFNGKDGELIWRFYKAMDDKPFSSTDQLIERMMRKVSRNFPYEK